MTQVIAIGVVVTDHHPVSEDLVDPDSPDHTPRGTTAIVAVFGALVAAGWLALYFGLFMPRVSP